MEAVHGLFGGVLGYLFGMAIMAVASRWVLNPLEHAAEERNLRVQFTLADVFCLFVAMQLALGSLYWDSNNNLYQKVLVTVLIFVAVGYAWWSFVRMLSRAGVRVVWHRCILMLVVLPVTAIGSLAVGFVPSALVDLFMSKPNILRDVCILAAGTLLPRVIYRLGYFTRAIVASATKE
jgi:hypothetical protein